MPLLGISKANLISRGAARYADLVYLALRDKKLHKKGIAHTRLGSIDAGELAAVADLTWACVGMCVAKSPEEMLVDVGPEGTVFAYVGGKQSKEQIAKAKDLRACTSIGGLPHACGMNRQVFVRVGANQWRPMNAPESSSDVAGFEAIDGFDTNEIYAVGWEGEIWRCVGGNWTNCQSPVNVILSGVCCAPDKNVYACGQQGTLLRGRNEAWEILTTPDLDDDLWDVHWFDGKLYAASMSYLYTLDGDRLVPVNFGIEPPASFYRLTDADGVLWSVGQEAILSFDGAKWERWD